VPDYSAEQIQQARGSVAPIGDPSPEPEVPAQTDPAEAQSSELPGIDPEVARDLSEYTPEKLHSIVQLASKHIADALMQGILKHRQGGDQRNAPEQPMAQKVREQNFQG
jgi:hypothetical protein